MASIGNMSVMLTAKTSAFNRAIKSSRKRVATFGASVAGVARKLATFGAVAGAAAAAALVLITKRAPASIDATKKLSDSLGITIRNLTGFQLAAKIAGSSSEAIAKGIQFFVKNLGEAQAGIGEARLNLEKLGFSLDGIIDARPGEAIKIFAERMKQIEDPARKAAIANALFGRAGKDLLIFFALGREGLEKLIKENEAFGASFNAIDASKVELANDAIVKLQTIFKGLGNQIAIQVSPAITSIVEGMQNILLTGEGMGSGVSKAFDLITIAVGKTLGALSLLRRSVLLIRGAFTTIGFVVRKVLLVVKTGVLSVAQFVVTNISKMLGAIEIRLSDGASAILRVTRQITAAEALRRKFAVRSKVKREAGTGFIQGLLDRRRQELADLEVETNALRASMLRDRKEFFKPFALLRGKTAIELFESMKKTANAAAKATGKLGDKTKAVGVDAAKDRGTAKARARTAQFKVLRGGELALGAAGGAAARVQQVKDPQILAVLKEILAKTSIALPGADALIARPAG